MTPRQDREARVLAWLRTLGSGEFTLRQIADDLRITRDQAAIAFFAIERREDAECWQRAGHYGTHRYQLGPSPD